MLSDADQDRLVEMLVATAEMMGEQILDMLAWFEGTDNGKQATKDCGYDVIVGGQLFKSYADHPRVLVDLPKLKIQSTAAGRYQLLRRYYDAYKKTLGLKDFTPLSQDLIALQQIRERRALPLIQAGKIPEAIKAVSNIWASLPGAGYGQHEQERPTDRVQRRQLAHLLPEWAARHAHGLVGIAKGGRRQPPANH
jgi:muramidase (phage lysozyme)